MGSHSPGLAPLASEAGLQKSSGAMRPGCPSLTPPGGHLVNSGISGDEKWIFWGMSTSPSDPSNRQSLGESHSAQQSSSDWILTETSSPPI